ncbi:putative histone deacetylase [Medicago truncatula]|uniref:Putative histone deacetylase n=1 Tax=Medicago truncatula TaxID=3880 RepID=A0A396I2V1_MEDTR|nr:putative histone deacetylase [Medicago truncatula]
MLIVYSLLLDISFNSRALAIECLASDHEALVDFKNGLEDSHNHLSSWRNTNCCQWRGIYCDNITGAVVSIDLHNPHPVLFDSSPRKYEMWNQSGELRPSLMKLKSLRHLDLSFNTFNGIPIPEFFGSLVNLQYLNLSTAGLIPPHLGNLSHLQYLDLKTVGLHVENFQWVVGLVSLKYLAMNGVDLSSVAGTDLVSAVNHLPFLIELHLSSCHLFGQISSPSSLNFTSLAFLNLSSNAFFSKIPNWLVNISTLEHSGFYGNLTSLTYLDLSNNTIEGVIPSSIGAICNLKVLILSRNNMTGTFPEFLQGIENCPSRNLFLI